MLTGKSGSALMLFFTYWFVLFAAVMMAVYWAAPWPGVRKAWLLISCLVFHWHFAGPAGVIPILILGLATYGAGLSGRKGWCTAAIGLCVAALVFYKYTHFIGESVVGALVPAWAGSARFAANEALPTAPPLGISFFVFEFVHYLYDVRRGTAPLRHPADFCLFAVFWPSIVAGPIKRYEQFIPVLQAGVQKVNQQDVAAGLIRVGMGIVKKFIADNLTAYIDFWQPFFGSRSMSERWCLFGALGLRILFDFSGYSDMAIGFARMMGIRLPENFRWPYVSRSIGEFWRRWHISLSLWIRDYVYIPLGGGRHGITRRMLNGMVAFGLCGLWHGAAWHFLVWGLWHGAGLAIQGVYAKGLGPLGRGLAALFAKVPVIPWALTMCFVYVGWLWFFYPLPEAFRMLQLLFVK